MKEAGKGGAVVVMNNADYMVVKINHDQIKIKKTVKIVTTYFSKTLRIFEKFSSFLLKEQKKFLAKFYFQKITSIVYWRFTNLKLYTYSYTSSKQIYDIYR